jgi:hypothetical protein
VRTGYKFLTKEKVMEKAMRYLSAITLVSLLAVTGTTNAADGHSHGHDNSDGHHAESAMTAMAEQGNGMFAVKQAIDGYEVSFQVMKAKPGKEMGGSHDVMIKVEKDGKALIGIPMNTKVIHPDGTSETKKTMAMGDWSMAGYDLGHPGQHQLLILFKSADGEKHKGGVYYPEHRE